MAKIHFPDGCIPCWDTGLAGFACPWLYDLDMLASSEAGTREIDLVYDLAVLAMQVEIITNIPMSTALPLPWTKLQTPTYTGKYWMLLWFLCFYLLPTLLDLLGHYFFSHTQYVLLPIVALDYLGFYHYILCLHHFVVTSPYVFALTRRSHTFPEPYKWWCTIPMWRDTAYQCVSHIVTQHFVRHLVPPSHNISSWVGG